nr:unnamed protein product [Callosobruchus analis]
MVEYTFASRIIYLTQFHFQQSASHQQSPQGTLQHTSTSTTKSGRKTRDTASQEHPSPPLLGTQSSTTTEHSGSSPYSSSSSTSTESRKVREAENSYSNQGGSSYDNTRSSQTGQSGSSQTPYGKAQGLGSSHSSSDYGGVHPLGSSGNSQSGHGQLGGGVSSSTEHGSSNPYASRSY